MRLLIFIFVYMICFSSAAQRYCNVYMGDTVNCLDTNGLAQGRWISLDQRGKYILDEGVYVNGKKEGVWKDYFPNGKLKFTVTFKDDVPNGEAVSYYATGQMSERGYWGRYGWNGEYTVYYTNGCVHSKTLFDNEANKLKATYFTRDSCGLESQNPGMVKRYHKWILPRRIAYEAEIKARQKKVTNPPKLFKKEHPATVKKGKKKYEDMPAILDPAVRRRNGLKDN